MAYCPICGIEVSIPAEARFGEVFCSSAHAEGFTEKVRAARVEAVAARAVETADTEQRPNPMAVGAPNPRDWKHYVKMGACIGAPALALLFLAGGGGAVLGWAGALLPVLAVLACPVAMYFLMRSMATTGHSGDQRNPEGKK